LCELAILALSAGMQNFEFHSFWQVIQLTQIVMDPLSFSLSPDAEFSDMPDVGEDTTSADAAIDVAARRIGTLVLTPGRWTPDMGNFLVNREVSTN